MASSHVTSVSTDARVPSETICLKTTDDQLAITTGNTVNVYVGITAARASQRSRETWPFQLSRLLAIIERKYM
jgi:hypothetical protein